MSKNRFLIHIALHGHRFGTDPYLFVSHEGMELTESEAIRYIGDEYEVDRDSLEIIQISSDELIQIHGKMNIVNIAQSSE